MRLTNKVLSNSVSAARYQAALRDLQTRHWDEHEAVHDGSGRSEELPADMNRRHAAELLSLRKDRDALSIMEWMRAYGP